jgi:hypothetical protein
MKWVTRERPHIDRIACAWAIKKFVDLEAKFICYILKTPHTEDHPPRRGRVRLEIGKEVNL